MLFSFYFFFGKGIKEKPFANFLVSKGRQLTRYHLCSLLILINYKIEASSYPITGMSREHLLLFYDSRHHFNHCLSSLTNNTFSVPIPKLPSKSLPLRNLAAGEFLSLLRGNLYSSLSLSLSIHKYSEFRGVCQLIFACLCLFTAFNLAY